MRQIDALAVCLRDITVAAELFDGGLRHPSVGLSRIERVDLRIRAV
jgi:hypothetical protein